MTLLDGVTVVVVGLMVGNELAVSLFMNRAVWRLDDGAMAAELARVLGRVMPFWYALSLALLGAEAWTHRGTAGGAWALGAAVLWAAILVYTIAVLVPLNKRVASAAAGVAWRRDHERWDALHRVRIVLLVGAFGLLLWGLRC